jgi:hypothetical protein
MTDLSAKQFITWQESEGLSIRAAALELGIVPSQIQLYRQRGAPRRVALACAAVSCGAGTWHQTKRALFATMKQIANKNE